MLTDDGHIPFIPRTSRPYQTIDRLQKVYANIFPKHFSPPLRKERLPYALFGGQGMHGVYFDELQALYDTYKPYVSLLITAICTVVG